MPERLYTHYDFTLGLCPHCLRRIISHDRDFLPLWEIEFPKVAVVDTVGLRELLFAD